jgi:MFS family permease
MIPATLLITKLPAHRIVPASMTLWAIFTLLSFRAQSFSELAGYRFLVGFFEGPFFCSIEYVLGSWYRNDEIVRRAGIFYVSSSLGTVSTGLFAASIYQNLNGALGIPGWRWMYIISGIIGLPIALLGALTFPGTPSAGKRWYFTQDEFDLAVERMEACGRKEPQGFPFKVASLKRFFGRWHWWVLVPWNLLWIMGYMSSGQGAYTLWLKSNKQYSIPQVNNYTVSELRPLKLLHD